MQLNQIEEQLISGITSGEFTSQELLKIVHGILSAEAEVAEDVLTMNDVRQIKIAVDHIARAYHIVKSVEGDV